jgi:putative transposase
MPDHFHWLLQLGQGDLGGLLQQVKSRSAKAINRHLQRSGKVW